MAAASLICRKRGSPSSRPSRSAIQASRADAADADDLAREVGQLVAVEEDAPVVLQRACGIAACTPRSVAMVWARLPRRVVERDDQRRARDDARVAVDDAGELREGVHAVARARLGHELPGPLARLGHRPRRPASGRASSTSTRAYQTSILRAAANRAISARYDPAVSSMPRSRSRRDKPRSRPATAMLATSRLTSHSHGPGSVSSKSLTSKIRRRSGEPKRPKFERWASPQH